MLKRLVQGRDLNHRRPQWRVIAGDSQRYVEALARPYRDRLRLNCPVQSITRHADCVEVTPRQGETERFDQVILATQSDQALALLADATAQEREILSAIPYQANEVGCSLDLQ